jgi:acetyl esterase/lipase
VAKQTGSVGNGGGLEITEESINPLARNLCIGGLGNGDLVRRPITGFWLDSIDTSAFCRHTRARPPKAILWLAGGGYVTGYPLNDRPIFSLAHTLPLGEYTILAPSISRALSLERSFPIPLLDALAAYAHLREKGYKEEDIAVIGNSAGGGLGWSLVSYLMALDDAGIGELGVSKRAIMISVSLLLGGRSS